MNKIALALVLLLSPATFADAKPRKVEIAVTQEGYKPDHLTAKPGEKLLLVFTAKGDTGCCGTIVVPSANARGHVEEGKPLEIAVTMPASGKLTFSCAMNMCKGEVAPK